MSARVSCPGCEGVVVCAPSCRLKKHGTAGAPAKVCPTCGVNVVRPGRENCSVACARSSGAYSAGSRRGGQKTAAGIRFLGAEGGLVLSNKPRNTSAPRGAE